METKALHQGKLAVTNPMDDTHKTFKRLKKAGITEAQAEVFTETFKGLSDQTMQVNENLLMVHDGLDNKITGVRDEFREEFTAVREEITGIRLELKDIHHNAASNYQKLDAKIDNNYQKLGAKIDSNFLGLDKKIDFSHTALLGYMEKSNAQAQVHQAQTQVSYMRWNIGMFIGLAGLMIALIRPWE